MRITSDGILVNYCIESFHYMEFLFLVCIKSSVVHLLNIFMTVICFKIVVTCF